MFEDALNRNCFDGRRHATCYCYFLDPFNLNEITAHTLMDAYFSPPLLATVEDMVVVCGNLFHVETI